MKPILFVDLDESLIRTDILREQLMRAFATSFWSTVKMLFREKFQPERVKTALADKIDIDPATVPYNWDVLKIIRQARDNGQQVILATAAHEHAAHKIAGYLNLFDGVLATTQSHNCKGKNKLAIMKAFAGTNPFDYIGDSTADLTIFPHAQKSYIVGKMAYPKPHCRIAKPSVFRPVLRAMRPAHWVKNALVFLPLLTSHNLTLTTFLTAVIGFICFSLTASAIYIINDMADVEDDRHHPQKKHRPFAKGDLTIDEGMGLSLVFLAAAGFISFLFMPAGLWVLGSYACLTFLYSFSFKTQAILDVFCLSTLYTIRVLYGQVINNIHSSSWLLAFCIFFFLSLAFIKRVAEIEKNKEGEQPLSLRRGYIPEDILLIKIAGISSGLISLLVLALYINSDKVTQLYHYPDALWGAAYVLLYWKLRLWLIASRGQMNQDPVIFAVRDPVSYLTGSLVILFGLIAKGLFT